MLRLLGCVRPGSGSCQTLLRGTGLGSRNFGFFAGNVRPQTLAGKGTPGAPKGTAKGTPRGPLGHSHGPHHSQQYATHRDFRYRYSSGGPSFWERFKLPLLFAGGALAFSHWALPVLIDNPAMTALRRHPEYLVYGIIGINVANALAWRSPAFARTMNRYFLLHKQPQRFNMWSMVGSAFSHQEWWHLGINMFVLWQFGIPVAKWIGASNFLSAYLDGCVLSSLGSLVLPWLAGSTSMLPSLGASGAIYSMVGLFSYLAPNARLAFWFIPLPIGAWWVFLGTVGYSLFKVVAKTPSGFDHAGHLAGALAGIGWGYLVTEKIKRLRQRRRV